jgi:hypothetical protein
MGERDWPAERIEEHRARPQKSMRMTIRRGWAR